MALYISDCINLFFVPSCMFIHAEASYISDCINLFFVPSCMFIHAEACLFIHVHVAS